MVTRTVLHREAERLPEFAAQTLLHLRRDFVQLDRSDIWTALSLAAAVSIFSAWRIDATQLSTLVNNCIIGADSVTYSRWLEVGNYLGLGVKKHALAVVLVAALSEPMVWLGLSHAVAVALGMGAIWGGVAATAYLYFRRAGLSRYGALATAVLAMSTAGVATHSGIVETYGATLLMISAACLFLPVAAKTSVHHPLAGGIMAGMAGAGLALANAPSAAFILVYWACLSSAANNGDVPKKLALNVALPLAFIALAVVAPALAAEGTDGMSWHGEYLGRYSQADNFTDPTTIANYAATVIVFSFVIPLEYLQCRFVVSELFTLGSRPLALGAVLGTISLVVTGIARSLKGPRFNETLGLLGAIGCVLVFYLYFNPDEAMLYSPQWLMALFFAAAPDFRGATLWAGAAALLCLSANVPPLHHPRTSDPEVCCPNPPASMLPREYPQSLGAARGPAEGAR